MLERRKFIKKALLATIQSYLGYKIINGNYLPEGILPVGLKATDLQHIQGKHPELILLNDRPINAETPAHLLDNSWTANNVFFVRNNGIPPAKPSFDNWTIEFGGESAKREVRFTINELKRKFKEVSYYLTLECAGNGRSEYNPPAKGNQWGTGAVGCAKWTGIRLRDVLEYIGYNSDTLYIAYEGKDTHLSGDPKMKAISRGVPISKALQEQSLIAYKMNDEDLPLLNGYPVRLVFGGWPASCSGKWLSKVLIRNKVHDGAKMGGQSYRVPKFPVAPGAKVSDEDMKIIESMPVKSLITSPKTGMVISSGKSFELRGSAWVGDRRVTKVEYSIDFGRCWIEMMLDPPINFNAWQRFKTSIQLKEKGYYEIWSRATDDKGDTQPMLLPGWNPKGYLNNACHRIAVKVK